MVQFSIIHAVSETDPRLRETRWAMFLAILLFWLPSQIVGGQELSPRLREFQTCVLEWRTEIGLPELPKLEQTPAGLWLPDETHYIDQTPQGCNQGVVHPAPFLMRPLSAPETQTLLITAGDALAEHDAANPNMNQGFRSATLDRYTVFVLAEVYEYGRSWAPTEDGVIVFLFLRNDGLHLMASAIENDEPFMDYIPWLGSGMNYLTLERKPDGSFEVVKEGAAG